MPVPKPPRLLDLGSVDISAIQPLVARLPEQLWAIEDARKENRYDVFHDTRHIVFRFIRGNRDHQQYYSNPIWDVWKSRLLPVMEQATAPYAFHRVVYPKVMLARLAAGAVIDRHSDGAGSHVDTHKIHVPIETNDRVVMYIDDLPFKLAAGRAYEVNNIVPHSVENRGERDRIHLIFEAYDEAALSSGEKTLAEGMSVS